jgi:hypothetical protein
MKIPTEWTAAERIDLATTMLNIIHKDIKAGRYEYAEHPSIGMVLMILHEDPTRLNRLDNRVWIARTLRLCGVAVEPV